MKKEIIIDGISTFITFVMITVLLALAVCMFGSCTASQPVCPAYKVKPKVERTTQHSRASDPKPRVSRGYVNCVGCR